MQILITRLITVITTANPDNLDVDLRTPVKDRKRPRDGMKWIGGPVDEPHGQASR